MRFARPTHSTTPSQRAALAEAQEGLDIVMAQLKDAKARLAGVQNRLAELQKGFDDAVAKKQVRNDPTTPGLTLRCAPCGHAPLVPFLTSVVAAPNVERRVQNRKLRAIQRVRLLLHPDFTDPDLPVFRSMPHCRSQQELEQKAERCVVQLSNAEKLIGGLGGEEKRWKDTVATLTLAMDKLPGGCWAVCNACFSSRDVQRRTL